jgi:hypothetical protein
MVRQVFGGEVVAEIGFAATRATPWPGRSIVPTHRDDAAMDGAPELLWLWRKEETAN